MSSGLSVDHRTAHEERIISAQPERASGGGTLPLLSQPGLVLDRDDLLLAHVDERFILVSPPSADRTRLWPQDEVESFAYRRPPFVLGWGPIELAAVRLTMPPPRSFGPRMPWIGFRSWCRWHWRQANPPTTEGAEPCYPSVSPIAELGATTSRVPAA